LSKRRESMSANVGYGTMAMSSTVVSIPSPEAAPLQCLKDDARERSALTGATEGRRTRSIVTDSDRVIASAVQGETLTQRLFGGYGT
jgi:regulator of extracellular matrix RemA (YlzA/DUF370 family)